MLDDIDTKEKVAHSSYADMQELDFQILLTDNCFVNPSRIYIYFPIKIKKSTNNASDIESDLMSQQCFAHFVKEISNKIWKRQGSNHFQSMKFFKTQTLC